MIRRDRRAERHTRANNVVIPVAIVPPVEEGEVDEYIGETFEDKDPRSGGRRIRVKAYDALKDKYMVETVFSPKSPQVGRMSHVTGATLDKRYRKVSH